MRQTISCIIPAYNADPFLGEAIRSALEQTLPPDEVIIVDDGSTDHTAQVARSFGGIVTLVSQENQGAAAARNNGLGRARGDFIAFLDADDLWTPDKLAVQMRCLATAPDAICVGFAEAFGGRDAGNRKATVAYSTATLLARREVVDVIGAFNNTLRHADTLEWFLRGRAAGVEDIVVPDTILLRRLHSTSLSVRDPRASHIEHLRVLRQFTAKAACERG